MKTGFAFGVAVGLLVGLLVAVVVLWKIGRLAESVGSPR